MSKIVAGTAFVLLSGATVTGGVLLSKSNKQTAEDNSSTTYDAEIPTSLADFQQNEAGKNEGCIQSVFPKLATLPSTPASGQTSTVNIDENFFDTSKKTEGCLVVNWDKDTYSASSNNWRGSIRFLWAVKGESKGFIVFLTGTAANDNTNKEIKWEAVTYSVAKSGDNQAWTASSNQNVAANGKSFKKTASSTPEDNTFPRPHADMGISGTSTFWGLFNSSSDLDSICTESGCSGDPTKTKFRGYWDWMGEVGDSSTNKKTLADWTQEMDKWWKTIFDETKFKAKTLSEKHKGTWTNRVKEPSTTSGS